MKVFRKIIPNTRGLAGEGALPPSFQTDAGLNKSFPGTRTEASAWIVNFQAVRQIGGKGMLKVAIC